MLRRGMKLNDLNFEQLRKDLSEFADNSYKLKKCKNKREKLYQLHKKRPQDKTLQTEFEEVKQNLNEIRKRFFALEDAVVPFLIKLPASIDLSRIDRIIDESKGSLDEETASRLGPVNHLRLGYFNHALQPSIVGPEANFLTGLGAEAFYAFTDYLIDHLMKNGFELFSGLDIVKSAIIEAVNNKDVNEDMFELNDKESDSLQKLHLTGDSSLGAFISLLVAQKECKPCKIAQTGSLYGDELKQTYCVSATVVEHENDLTKAHNELYELFWDALTKIGFRCRSSYCSIEQLSNNETSKLVISIWLYSTRQWIPVLKLSNHSDYILRRAGMKDSTLQLLHATIDLLPLIQCWLEHFQDPSTGHVSTPNAIKSYSLS